MCPVSGILRIWLILMMVAVVWCFILKNPESVACPSNFCAIALFKCISEDSCNGTLLPPMSPCHCCPSCLEYLDEGDQCVTENDSSGNGGSVEETSAFTNGKYTENISERRQCRPGLTCKNRICITEHSDAH